MADRCPWWAPPLLAVQFLTRLPVPGTHGLSADAARAGLVRAVGWFPLVGAMIGAMTAMIALAAAMLWPAPVAVAIALIVEARLTGAFHEDALADFCDGFGGGQSADDVLRIMRDSRIGSYGSVGLILAIGLRAALMATILTSQSVVSAAGAIVAASAFGRLLAVAVMVIVPPAPVGQGLARDVGAGVGIAALAFALLTALPGLGFFVVWHPLRMVAALALAALFAWRLRRVLLRRLGGSTGDCLGFAAYAGQLILLLAATATGRA